MPYVSAPLLEEAIRGLQGRHPLAVVVLPAMVSRGVTVVSDADHGVAYGSADELEVLRQAFALPGSPPDRPFRAIWEQDPSAYWRDQLYPGRALQRQRKDRADRNVGFYKKRVVGSQDLWGLRPNVGPELSADIRRTTRFIDLAIWYGRDWDVSDLDALQAEFLQRFPLTQDALLPSIYSDDIPDHYRKIPLEPTPLTAEQVADVANAAAPPEPPLQSHVDATDTIFQDVQSLLDDYAGVILTGPPGTSKTWYAHNIAALLTDRDPSRVRFIQFHSSYQYEDFVEGYVPKGSKGFELVDKHLLEMCRIAREAAPDICVLVIDELSRSDPGRVFGEALTYIEKTLRGQPFSLASGRQASIPANLVFIATMNPLDRGVDDVDAALERRFGKIPMDPSPTILRQFLTANSMDAALIGKVETFFRAVQTAAKDTPAAAIGHTYFRTVRNEADLHRLWKHQLRFVFDKAYRINRPDFEQIERAWNSIFSPPTLPGAPDASAAASEPIQTNDNPVAARMSSIPRITGGPSEGEAASSGGATPGAAG